MEKLNLLAGKRLAIECVYRWAFSSLFSLEFRIRLTWQILAKC
jgi:hypothetical protein